jgi:hypothetical protein
MKAPKVELKNIKTFQGHDGTGLNADVWINGINCMHVYDGAYGGEFDYTENLYNNPKAAEVKANIKLLDDYIANLPEKPFTHGNTTLSIKVNRDIFIDDILAEKEKQKAIKKMQKLFQTAIVFGIPNGNSYQYVNFKRPLSDIPLSILKTKIIQIKLTYCKKGIVILNTNLSALNVQL